jgi:hypothetical protein
MKTNIRLYLGTAILMLVLSVSGFAQGTNIVTLNVDTDDINDSNVLEKCFFTWEKPDGTISTSASGAALEDWLITINITEIVEWKGSATTDDNVIVDIIRIKRESGTPIFSGRTLRGNNDPSGEKIRAKPDRITNDQNGDFKYTIKFRVKGMRGSFDIDPKIKVGDN